MPAPANPLKLLGILAALATGIAGCSKDEGDPGAAKMDLTDAATDLAAGADTFETTAGGIGTDAALAEATSTFSSRPLAPPTPADATAVSLDQNSVTDGLSGAPAAAPPAGIDSMAIGTGTAGGFPTSEPMPATEPAPTKQ